MFERSGYVGGRTRTVRFADDHRLDTGAAWLTSFYRNALRYTEGLRLLRRDVAGTPRLRLVGRPGAPVAPAPFGPMTLARSRLLTWGEKARMVVWVIGNASHGPHVGPRSGRVQRNDDTDAASHARRRLGDGVLECVLRPAFETMVFAPVDELSTAFVGNWAGAALVARYSVPAAGMDAPWRRLAARLEVRLHQEVVAVEAGRPRATGSAGVSVRFVVGRPDGGARTDPEVEHFDGVVVATPAPVAARIVDEGRPGRPAWLDEVRYAQHVFAYGARPVPSTAAGADRVDGPRSGPTDIHPAGPGRIRIGSVQMLPGGDGRVPSGWQAAAVSATGPWSAELLRRADSQSPQRDPGVLFESLWRDGLALEPALFAAAECRIRHVVRWRHAVPVFGPGHLTRLATWQPTAPIALAGDWAWYPCVEGAVISGQRAAAALLTAG